MAGSESVTVVVAIIVLLVGIFGPEWGGAVLLLPVIALETRGLVELTVPVGPVDFRLQDLLLLLLMVRWITRLALRPTLPFGVEVMAAFTFVIGLIGMTVLAARSVPQEATSVSSQALARLAAQFVVISVVATAGLKDGQLGRLRVAIEWFLLACALSVVWTYVMGPRGIPFGELQGLESGQLRAFGLVGDSVGFILVFGVILDLQRKRFARAMIQLIAIWLSGTLGALLVLGVALTALWLTSIRAEGLRSGAAWVVPLVAVLLTVAVQRGAGTVAQRLASEDLLQSGSGLQRAVTASLALDVARDRPWGVGYQGFSVLVHQVGAADVLADRLMGSVSSTFVANAGNQYLQTYTDGGGPAVLLLLLMLVLFARGLKKAEYASSGSDAQFFRAAFAWLLGIALGNQTAVWVLPSGLILLLLLTVTGAASAAIRFAPPISAVPLDSPGTT